MAEVIEKIGNNLKLFRRTQITGVNSVELHIQLFPLGDNLGHYIRQVQKGEVGILRMIGQYRRRQGANLKTQYDRAVLFAG